MVEVSQDGHSPHGSIKIVRPGVKMAVHGEMQVRPGGGLPALENAGRVY